MQYLEDWEKASIKYCKISLKTKNEFADDTKRGLFLARFNVKDYTSTLIDSIIQKPLMDFWHCLEEDFLGTITWMLQTAQQMHT